MATRRIMGMLSAGLVVAVLGGAGAAAQSPQPAAPDKEGVRVGNPSFVRKLVSAETLESAALMQYGTLKKEATSKGALLPPDHPQNLRLRRIARDLLPHAHKWNPRAKDWRWEVVLIKSNNINAFCMPGGKIAFFTGIIDQLKLTDDEVAMVMGHEMAHALLEHAAGRAGQQRLAQIATLGASVFSQILGYGDLGGQVASGAAQLTLLRFSRGDETEADLVGMDIAARAGFDPRAAITLWQRMAAAARGQQQPQFLSTHPSHDARMKVIADALPKVMPLYAQAIGRSADSLPPYRSNYGQPVPWPLR
jgi:predicted Zn-dependent protease